jgi:hypothetical protein
MWPENYRNKYWLNPQSLQVNTRLAPISGHRLLNFWPKNTEIDTTSTSR